MKHPAIDKVLDYLGAYLLGFLNQATKLSQMCVLLTWNPPVMDSLNQTCFFCAFLLRYQFFMGMLDSLGKMQVAPVSMSQWTLMASRADPWLGSTQYMPVVSGNTQGE